MSNTTYNPFNSNLGWTFGENIPGDRGHKYLGPCPDCGTSCFNYGGGWRCHNYKCFNGVNNPYSDLGPRPSWWNTGLQVKLDGTLWCAHHSDFINLQESPAGFGKSPKEAVNNLLNPTPHDTPGN